MPRRFLHKPKEERRKYIDVVVVVVVVGGGGVVIAFHHVSSVLIRILSQNTRKGIALRKTGSLSKPLFQFSTSKPPTIHICQRLLEGEGIKLKGFIY